MTWALLTCRVSCEASPTGRAGYCVREMGPEPPHVQPGGEWLPGPVAPPGSLAIPALSQVFINEKKMFSLVSPVGHLGWWAQAGCADVGLG